MSHPPILNTDLTDLRKDEVDSEVKTSARSSIWRFAWDMRGGDIIYIGDSVRKSIIARGYINSELGERAYRYNGTNPITVSNEPDIPWRHEVPVTWDKDFLPFQYKDGAPRYTVTPFDPAWAQGTAFSLFENDSEKNAPDLSDESFINESAYMRATPASQKNVLRLHAALSNRFKAWLWNFYQIKAVQERGQIDLQFLRRKFAHLAELKICYGLNTKHAIREAIGQLFEYNHYPAQVAKQFWWLVLDCKPTEADTQYISTLIEKYQVPLILAWQEGERFEVFPKSPL